MLTGAFLVTTQPQAVAEKTNELQNRLIAPELLAPSNDPCEAERIAYADAYASYLEALQDAQAALLALEICEFVTDPEEPEDPPAASARLEHLASMSSVLEQ